MPLPRSRRSVLHWNGRERRIRRFLALLAALTLTAVAAAGEPLHIRVEAPAGAAAPIAVHLSLTPEGGAGEPVAREVAAPGEVVLDLPAGSRWEVAARAEDYWSKPQPALAAAGGEPVALRLWPAGRIRGEVQAAPGEALPKEISLRFQPAPGPVHLLPRSRRRWPARSRSAASPARCRQARHDSGGRSVPGAVAPDPATRR